MFSVPSKKRWRSIHPLASPFVATKTRVGLCHDPCARIDHVKLFVCPHLVSSRFTSDFLVHDSVDLVLRGIRWS
jgi:hypothetical protein